MHIINTGRWKCCLLPPPTCVLNVQERRCHRRPDRRGRPAALGDDDRHRDSPEERGRERGGASHGCRWAERKESCTLAAVATVTVSRQQRQTHGNRALNNTYLLDMRESLETSLTSARLPSVFVMDEEDAVMPPDASLLPL